MEEINYVQAPREQVMIIDKIVKLVKDSNGTVESSNHWKALELMFELFEKEFPDHYQAFVEEIKVFRNSTEGNNGIIKDGKGDSMQHQLEIPERFYQYVKAIFPNQLWDRTFFKKLSNQLPIFKVSNNL